MSWDDNWIMYAQFYNADGTPDPNRQWSGKFSELAFENDSFAEDICVAAGANISTRGGIYYRWWEFVKGSEPVRRMKDDLFKYKKGQHRLDTAVGTYIIFRIEKEEK